MSKISTLDKIVFCVSLAFLILLGGFILRFSLLREKPEVDGIDVPNEKIVFTSKADSEKGELYIMDVNGSNIERLTFNDFHENNPALSPDRKKVAFHRSKSEQDWSSYEIYILDLETGEETRLTNNNVLDGHPDWSPDGKKLIFASFRDAQGKPSSTADIYMINVDGTGLTQLTDSPYEDNDPEWSPDGTKIVFKSTRDTKMVGKEQIYVMDADGSNVRRLTFNNNSDHDPSWSPDSKTIAFMRYEGPGIIYTVDVSLLHPVNIYKVDLNGVEEKLTDYEYLDWLPVFSGDGEKILFYKSEPIFKGDTIVGYRHRLTIMDIDGSNQRTLIPDNEHTNSMGNFDW